jgi:CBS domain-containing protein
VEKAIEKILQEPATAVMTRCPLPVHPDTPVFTVLERFSHSNHPVIVVDTDGTLVGVITPMDLISVLYPGDGQGGRHLISGLDRFLKSTAQNARDLMSDEPLTVPEDTKICDALQAMEQGHSSSVIIVNEKNVAVGCIELADIIAYLYRFLPR